MNENDDIVEGEIVESTPLEKQEQSKKVPATGFHTNPERINKNGRPPKGWAWSELLEDAGEKEVNGKKRKEVVADMLFKLAEEGNVSAIKEIFDRMEGKPMQRTDLTSGGEKIGAASKEIAKEIQDIIKDENEANTQNREGTKTPSQ